MYYLKLVLNIKEFSSIQITYFDILSVKRNNVKSLNFSGSNWLVFIRTS